MTPLRNSKFAYKVVATTYQGNFVFLDTIKVNTLFLQLLTNNLIPQFQDPANIRREVGFDDSRFDFTFVHHQKHVIVEVKSCTVLQNLST